MYVAKIWNKNKVFFDQARDKNNASKPKVFVAMSGGVDSSVTAALLKQAAPDNFEKLSGRPTPNGFRGFEVRGVHVKMWSDPSIPCNFKEDRYDAMKVAAKLDIPFETWDFTEEYRREVVQYMVREYAIGRTPNPDVMCNRHIKFGVFLKHALQRGADYIATGHYVRLRRSFQLLAKRSRAASWQLEVARDSAKDQSYFLWTLTPGQLKNCLFPVGEYAKPEVRRLAREFGLPTAEKKDSQGICFIGEINVRDFLKKYIAEERGPVVTTDGRKIGEHDGLSFYTIGQRAGLGIGGGIPLYVAEKNFSANTLVVSEGPYDESLFKKELVVSQCNWISGIPPVLPLRCLARIRYRQPLQKCLVVSYKPGVRRRKSVTHNLRFLVLFDEPQRAVTPGQSAVFYKGDEVLGGGIIV